MACFSPITAYRISSGELIFHRDSRREILFELQLPCGKCRGCRLDRAGEWSLRGSHELTAHAASCWLTLTFDDAHFPASNSAWRREVVLFGKRLRKYGVRELGADARIRTFGCCELGGVTRRPHAHLCVFGIDFIDRVPWSRGPTGELSYRSAELSKLWPAGIATVADLNERTIGYTARYTMTKLNGEMARQGVEVRHPLTGDVLRLLPSFPVLVSKHPGIGSAWCDEFGMQQVEQGAVIEAGGVRRKLPRYYVKRMKRIDRLAGSDAAADGAVFAREQAWNRTPERLAVREEVFEARTKALRRSGV